MRRYAVLVLAAIALGVMPAAAEHCHSDPECNAGRGAIAGYICVRSEINPYTNEFNGRICEEHPEGETWYAYLRYIGNREPVVLCHNGEQIFPERDPNAPDFCTPVSH